MVAKTEVLILQADGEQEVMAEAAPIVEPLKVGARLAEELKLHLLELTHTEDEVARVISFRKLLPIWPMPKGSLRRVVRWTFTKFVKMPCAVSGRR